jgi:hypothetical protein
VWIRFAGATATFIVFLHAPDDQKQLKLHAVTSCLVILSPAAASRNLYCWSASRSAQTLDDYPLDPLFLLCQLSFFGWSNCIIMQFGCLAVT